MNFQTKKEVEATTVQSILVAQDSAHQGALHGLVSNGGRKSIGNYIIEFVNNGSQFATIQIYQCALGIQPKVQSWNKTKTITQKVIKEVPMKPKTQSLNVQTSIESEDIL